MKDSLKAVFGAGLLLVVILATFSMAGAATHDVNNATEYHNETYVVDDDVQNVYIDVEDTNGTTVHAYFYDTNGTADMADDTEVHNETLSAGDGEVVTSQVDTSSVNDTEYRVVLEGDSNSTEPVSISSGVTKRLDGGAGGVTVNSKLFGVPLWGIFGILILGAGALVYVEVSDG